jgi:ubiquinone/menaquinone biosynthesis C-methylase UbiE
MTEPVIQFVDGASYEQYMGVWSRFAGETFLDWLAPKPGLQWLDVGCGNGAFTVMLAKRCAPASLDGVDPSAAQLAFARTVPELRMAQFREGDAMALPYPDNAFDATVMPLVIFFVPDPARGVAEMTRVVRPGGVVTAYAWDMLGGGFPYQALREEMSALGVVVPEPPSPEASRIDKLLGLWTGAGLEAVEACAIPVQRTFADFEEFWTVIRGAPSMGSRLAAMNAESLELLRSRMQERLPADAAGRVTYGAVANAVKGRVKASR